MRRQSRSDRSVRNMSPADQIDSEISDLIPRLSTVTECDQAAVRLASLGTAAVSALKKFLFEGRPSVVYQPRRAAVEALARIGAKDVLIQYLTWNHPIEDAGSRFGEECVQNAAARELAKFGTRDVLDVLLTFALPRLRPGVVEALGQLGSIEALPYLFRALEDDLCEKAAMDGLRKIGRTAEVALVSAALTALPSSEEERPSSVRRRMRVLQLLVEVGLSAPCWALLKPLFDDANTEIVVEMAKLAVTFGDSNERRSAARRLIEILPNADWFLRGEIEDSLLKLYPEAEAEVEQEFARKNNLTEPERILDPGYRTLRSVRQRTLQKSLP